ncbi:ras-related and estrogen-regulated growth inhibitor isoform X2 [Plodia interpunctella]|uniref:ras-related and estrogen-regulated growth inhibitor isoform X2 n=1 Tax=Plodia interpunctella TaxID=58824 RepID=UPI002368EC36|nr:ras-related and estrogen-regulated growth inhibitor isoform X2 [Plodia interpunctella]
MSSTTSPRSSLAKLVLYPKPKPFKVMVLGQAGVGKSAMVVRFITRRFIGDYDPNLEKIYAFQTVIDNEMVYFEILDSAGESHESEYANLENNIRWAEAFILMYSVTDKCSFDECHRLKFLINYNKRKRRLASSMKEGLPETPVVLVGNKADQAGDRMVSTEEGQRRSKEIGCVCFHEISVRESIDQVWGVFRDARRFWRVSSKWHRGRSDADVHPTALGRPLARAASDTASETVSTPSAPFGCWTEVELKEEEDQMGMARSDSTSSSGKSECPDEFRARASTDSRLPPRPARTRHPPPCRPLPTPVRRMSVAMKGNNPSTY